MPSPGEVHALEIARLRDSKFVRFGDVHHPRRRARASARVRADGDVEETSGASDPAATAPSDALQCTPNDRTSSATISRAASKRPARVQTDQRGDASSPSS